jgi:hypothetical protein
LCLSNINISLSEHELEATISGLLFSCSVNVVSNTSFEYQKQLLDIAEKLKTFKPDIRLTNVQFVEEENYEDSISETVLNKFKNNIEVTTFDCV